MQEIKCPRCQTEATVPDWVGGECPSCHLDYLWDEVGDWIELVWEEFKAQEKMNEEQVIRVLKEELKLARNPGFNESEHQMQDRENYCYHLKASIHHLEFVKNWRPAPTDEESLMPAKAKEDWKSVNICKGCGYTGTECILILQLHNWWCKKCYDKLKALGVLS